MPYPPPRATYVWETMTEKVLVTGGFGLVGAQTVRRLAADGHAVVATDLGTPAQRKAAASLPADADAHWANLTDQREVDRLVAEVSPTAIVHLAAVIPPAVYRNRELGRRVNVDATAALLRAAQASCRQPRFVLASSNAVYGSRNPHRHHELLTADSSLRASDLYGAHKIEAENHLRATSLEWVILRLGGVISVEPGAMPFTGDALFFESALPTDGRIHTVDVRDVAAAFAAAATADVAGETLLIAGDESHLHRQKDVGLALAAARGVSDVLPAGRPGDPDGDENWFVTDWLDTTRAQQALSFQHHSWPDMLADAGHRRMAALPDVLRGPRCAAVSETPSGVSGRTGPLRRPVGCDQVSARRTSTRQ
jgi:nucleoside-diphosphate-sugar epimerase